jgi:protein transport protein SEC24
MMGTAQITQQLESFSLGPSAPGQPDATDESHFPRPLIGDGQYAPTEVQLMLPTAPFEPGNCDPRIMRPVLACVPNSMSLKSTWHVPMGIILQPLQSFGSAVPVVDGTVPESILRCATCRSYMNPFNQWTAGGRSFRCVTCADLCQPARMSES